MVMLVPNLNLSMLLSQYAETMIPTYEIMQTPLSCYGILQHVKERLAIYCSLLKRSLRFSYGQHYIEWDSPTALNVTRTNEMRKADNEHSPAMIEVMNRIKYAFCHGPLRGKYKKISHPLQLNVCGRRSTSSAKSLSGRDRSCGWLTLYMSSTAEMSWYFEAIMSVTFVESTPYHCCL